eukprot:TRINITY_DN93083_c0_g1_i1.p1 TRINITY_DN93083_c0_g1~~TRINITY_DN93083_c0_g1_i1.p1  ORF type:complete len:274 (+),score=24.71 TRINITY_DN93083_c0_g1_i1:119-940(+)
MTLTLLLLLLLVIAISCEEHHHFVYEKGTMKFNSESYFAFGDIAIEWRDKDRLNFTTINGMYEGPKHVPFALVFDTTSFKKYGEVVAIKGICTKGAWDDKWIPTMEGSFEVTGTWTEISFSAVCVDTNTQMKFEVKVKASKYDCDIFKAKDAGKRARYLLGEPMERFMPAAVPSFAYYNYPYIGLLKDCELYLTQFGKVVNEIKPGYVIVGKEGKHCAIVDNEGDQFIHSNPIKKVVTSHPLVMLNEFFRNGWVVKMRPCRYQYSPNNDNEFT